jgi:AraC-like DNA-binding protein
MLDQNTPEKVSLFRNEGVPGAEVRVVGASARAWSFYSTGFEFVAPGSWLGDVRHRGATALLEPGRVLCAAPGEMFAAQRVRRAGSRASLLIEEGWLTAYLDQAGLRPQRPQLRPVARMSTPLAAALLGVFRAFQADGTKLEVQTSLVEFFTLAIPELFGGALHERGETRPPSNVAERIRERLERDPSESLDLDALAGEVGLSRFGSLRAFKREYGVPPHAYRMSMRLGLARSSLRRGAKPADVAAKLGFCDQSHLTRLFKHRFGITPGEYVRRGYLDELDSGAEQAAASGCG